MRSLGTDLCHHINAGFDLIPVAVARHPGQAVPLAGSWFGGPDDFHGMSVSVTVLKLGNVAESYEK
jgi:hypothetical protein